MTWTGWLALAAVCAIAALPSAASVRVGGLADRGRLLGAAVPEREPRPIRLPPSARAGPVGAVLVGAAPVGAVRVGAALVGAGLVAGIALRFGVLPAAAAGSVLAAARVLVRDLVDGRAARRRHRELLTAVGVLAGELTAGAQPAAALAGAAEASASMHAVFAPAADAARRGADAPGLLADSPIAEVRAVGLAWRLADSTGAALAGVVDRVAADLAAQDELRRTVRVALAGPRSSALLLSGLPVVGIGLGVAMGARPMDFLLADGAGRALGCAGVLLDVAGVLWMRRIVGRVERA